MEHDDEYGHGIKGKPGVSGYPEQVRKIMDGYTDRCDNCAFRGTYLCVVETCTKKGATQ